MCVKKCVTCWLYSHSSVCLFQWLWTSWFGRWWPRPCGSAIPNIRTCQIQSLNTQVSTEHGLQSSPATALYPKKTGSYTLHWSCLPSFQCVIFEPRSVWPWWHYLGYVIKLGKTPEWQRAYTAVQTDLNPSNQWSFPRYVTQAIQFQSQASPGHL